jgi:hypothetical protein
VDTGSLADCGIAAVVCDAWWVGVSAVECKPRLVSEWVGEWAGSGVMWCMTCVIMRLTQADNRCRKAPDRLVPPCRCTAQLQVAAAQTGVKDRHRRREWSSRTELSTRRGCGWGDVVPTPNCEERGFVFGCLWLR